MILHPIDDVFVFARINQKMNLCQNLNHIARCFLLFYLFCVYLFYLNLSFFFPFVLLFSKNLLSISFLLFVFFVFPHLLFALLNFSFFCVFLILCFTNSHRHFLYFFLFYVHHFYFSSFFLLFCYFNFY